MISLKVCSDCSGGRELADTLRRAFVTDDLLVTSTRCLRRCGYEKRVDLTIGERTIQYGLRGSPQGTVEALDGDPIGVLAAKIDGYKLK